MNTKELWCVIILPLILILTNCFFGLKHYQKSEELLEAVQSSVFLEAKIERLDERLFKLEIEQEDFKSEIRKNVYKKR